MLGIIVFSGIVFVVIVIISLVNWLTHIEMTTSHSDRAGWGSYKTFKEWFNQYEWSGDSVFENSLWNRELDCEYHASIIKFEGMGMKINNPFSYMLVGFYVRRYIKSNTKSNGINFKNKHPDRLKGKKGYNVYISDGDPIYVSMEEIYGKKMD